MKLSQILTNNDSGQNQVYLISEMTSFQLKCLMDVTNPGSDFNEIVVEDTKKLVYQDKYTRYSNPYFVSFTDIFSIRLDIKEIES